MDVSHKLLRLFLPIVFIGALGIGILDSILTPSPVLAHRHVNEEEYQDGLIDDSGSISGEIGYLFLVALFVLCLYSTVENIRMIKKGEKFDPNGEPQSLYWGFFNKDLWFSYVGCIVFGGLLILFTLRWLYV